MKSKSAKRVLSILIIFALSVATASPAIAVEPNNSHESDIQVFSAFDQFANVFPDVDDTVAAQSADNAAPRRKRAAVRIIPIQSRLIR